MRDPQPYAYSPLGANSIRLLNLGITDGTSITLKAVNINEAPQYFALSYAWDAQSDTVPIEVNGQGFSVSSDLADAILRLRGFGLDEMDLKNRVEWVWIDKICINQEDLMERSEQVQIMNVIYSQAIKTLIWLGPDGDECSDVWQLIEQIYGIYTLYRTEHEGV
ncbi:hypothetical protein NUW58_g1176 [Xylaria curta]|uniref:Uncharacterized protein n=1 Tax=Xylaria curta TaxID=42375 RepID=A0ACC1PMZ8_9PEZI|nr:hypothetical protein NUW58_g1176 [Xylaria curta]